MQKNINYHIQSQVSLQGFDCIVLPIFEKMDLSQTAQHIDQLAKGAFSKILQSSNLSDEGHTSLFHLSGVAPMVLCVYAGKKTKFQLHPFRKLAHSVVNSLQHEAFQHVYFDLEGFEQTHPNHSKMIRTTIEILQTTFYRFETFKTRDKAPTIKLNSLSFYLGEHPKLAQAEQAIKQAVALAKGMYLTRDLANCPSNHCTPHQMAEHALQLSKQYDSLTTEILGQEDPEVAKMGAFLAVAKGSAEPPQFVIVHYRPEGVSKQKPVVLVGKGVTFDSGGISIKPSNKMEEMKFDMTGAASVLGTLKTLAELKASVPVIGILPLTENLPSGTAIKPGDIVTTLSGQTVEIINTDAEGRLILADALSYSKRFNPALIIDIATLTGAIVVALGPIATGLLSSHDKLSQALEQAGQETGDRVWRLPLWDDYQKCIKSNIADISNTGDGSGAGSITAGCFLSQFVDDTIPWAHLDIAGTAWKSGKDKTATGRPVPLLVQYLLNYEASANESV